MYDPHYNEGSNVGGFLTGLLCGAALCAAGVLLFAPKAAEEIRRKLGSSTDDLRKTVGHMVSKSREAVDLGRQAFEDVRETATEQGKDLYNQGRQAVSDIAAHSKGVS